MFPLILDRALIEKIRGWNDLKRWERRDVGKTLRLLGLSYREIAAVIPVHKGTLSGWCSDLELTGEQIERLANKRPALVNRQEVGTRLRMQARRERSLIRSAAAREAVALLDDPDWRAGVVAYWSEGGKSEELRFANSDPDLVRLFLSWSIRYLAVEVNDFTVRLHLHSGQDEAERLRYWSLELGIDRTQFKKSYLKPEGTGHRKNDLYAGTALVRVARSGAHLQRVLGWIDALRESLFPLG